MGKIVLLLTIFMSVSLLGLAQTKTATGSIKDESGNPVPFATVAEKGTKNAVSADAQGNFNIKTKTGATLEVSATGFGTQSVAVTGSPLNITLTAGKDQVIQEVVVTALGIKRNKNDLGYAAQSISGDELSKGGQPDPIKALSGKIAGLQVTSSTGTPGGATYLQLRGATSITGGSQPLFVIDGVPIDNSQNYSGDPSDGTNNLLQGATNTNRGADINPNDIESITVLKGPAAAALYGINAGNGAVIITTKSGKAGRTSVEFNTGVSFDWVNRYPGLQNQWVKGSGGKIGTFPSSNRYSWGAKADTLMWTGTPNDFDVHGSLVGKSNPLGKTPFSPYDNMRSFFRVAPAFTNSISMSGGNEVATYRMGYTNLYQNSIVPTQNYQRNSINLAGSLKLSEKFKVSSNLNYIRSNSTQPQNGSNTSGIMLGLTRTPINFDNSNGATSATDPRAYLFPTGSEYAGTQRAYRSAYNAQGQFVANYDNPYWTLNKTPYTTSLNRLIGNVQLDYAIGNGFSALYRLGTDVYQDNRHQYYDIGSSAFNGGRLFYDRYTYTGLNSDLILSYSKKISEDFKFDGKVGNNFYSTKMDEVYTQGDGLVASDYDNMDNATVVKSSNFLTPYRSVSGYFDLNFDYKSLLMLEITGRNDWVSTLPKAHRSFFYPSASLSFVFSQLMNLDGSALNFGKLRLSAANVGKGAPPFSLTNYFTKATFSDGYTNGISFPESGVAGFGRVTTLGNQNLVPENTASYEAGLDLKFFRSRLGLDVTGYYSKGKDLIISAPLASSTGYTSQVINSGSIETKGIEAQLTGAPIVTSNFRWESFVNFSAYKNKILKLAEGVSQIDLNGFTGTTISQIAGYGAASVFGYGYERDSKGNIVINDLPPSDPNDKTPYQYPIAPAIQKFLGNTNPKFLMGFGNTFTYKHLSLYALLDWKHGGVMWNGTRGSLSAIGTSDNTNNRGQMYLFQGVLGHLNDAGELVHNDAGGNEVAGPGAVNTTKVPLSEAWYLGNGGGFGNLNEAFIEDASYIKLREVSLSYDFNSLFKPGKFIKGLTLGTYLRNVILWTPYKGIDPETSLTGATSAQGIDYFNMPGTASFGANLKLRF